MNGNTTPRGKTSHERERHSEPRSPPMNRMVAVFLLWGLCSSCSGDSGDHRVVVDTVAGVERVTNAGPGRWGEGDAWRVDTTGVVIGAVEDPPEEVFGSVSGVAVGAGWIYVADQQALEVRVFDRAGGFLHRFGREGDGPGEFRAIDGLAVGPEGDVVVRDPRLSRVSVFDADGGFLRSFRIHRPFTQIGPGGEFWVDREGRVYDRVDLATTATERRLAVVSYSPGGEVLDTAVVSRAETPAITVTRDGVPRASTPVPFSHAASISVGRGGTLVGGSGDAYTLAEIGPGDDTLRILRREVTPEPLPAWARDSATARAQWLREMAGGGEISDYVLPDRLPAYTRVLVDDEGAIWVERGAEPAPVVTYDVFDADGVYLGEVRLPRLRLFQIGEAFVAGVSRDELGVERVEVLPLRR